MVNCRLSQIKRVGPQRWSFPTTPYRWPRLLSRDVLRRPFPPPFVRLRRDGSARTLRPAAVCLRTPPRTCRRSPKRFRALVLLTSWLPHFEKAQCCCSCAYRDIGARLRARTTPHEAMPTVRRPWTVGEDAGLGVSDEQPQKPVCPREHVRMKATPLRPRPLLRRMPPTVRCGHRRADQ